MTPLETAKVNRLLDLMRRATANGTHREVAEAIARDWNPAAHVDPAGKVHFIGGAETQEPT